MCVTESRTGRPADGPTGNGRIGARVTEPECEPTPLRRITQAQLRALLAEHREWLKAGRPDWRQPDLSRIDFSGCDFSDVSSPLSPDSPYLVCLRQANLQDAEFGQAALEDVDLRDANLDCADLSQARNLLEAQLGGASLCHTQLPPSAAFKALDKVNDLSKTASGIFLSMLLGCVYAWLVNSATTDAQLLTDSSTSRLPIIQTDIAITSFYWDAPAVLLGLYLYFHIYMQRLWEGCAKLPAVFPGGETVDMQTYPWLVNDLVCRHFVQLQGRRPPLASLQAGLCILLAWWAVPFSLLMFWMRYVRLHDTLGTALHILMLFAATWAGIQLYRLAVATLDRDDVRLLRWRQPLRDPNIYRYGAIALAVCAVPAFLSYGAFWGRLPGDTPQEAGHTSLASDVSGWVVDMMEDHLGDRPFLDINGADICVKPANWTATDKEVLSVKEADLKKRNLRYARAYHTFLARADLQGSDLECADLRQADLQRAELQGADLRGTNLCGADLQGAILDEKTRFTGAE
ncbi:MAG: pentapeptide repeat-containing protein, partial [Armatimonadetes bacterium]|nr:pentapeptide repeat-containing protein [Armatimonadota bacterium]